MAKLSPSTRKIVFDESDWLSGLHPAYSTNSTDTPIPEGGLRNLTFASNFNPYRNLGYASPGFAPTSLTNASVVSAAVIRNITSAAESTTAWAYGIDSGTLVFQIDPTTGTLTSNGTWPHTINIAGTQVGSDIIAYWANISSTRQQCVFYSYNNTSSTTWNVGCYTLNGSTFVDDFMSTNPDSPLVATSSTNPHPMIIGDDDVLYIGDGNLLHGYDGGVAGTGGEGIFYSSVLVLPKAFQITSFAKYQHRLVIFGYDTSIPAQTPDPSSFYYTHSKAWFWDYLSQDPYDVVDLNDNYASAGFSYKGTVGCFSQGRKPVPGSNQQSAIRLYNGTTFEKVAMFDSNAPIHGGVEIVGDTVMWNSQGVIHQWGSPYPGFSQEALNKVTAGNGTTSGALRTLSTTLQVASSGTTTSGGLDKLTTNYNTGSVSTMLVTPAPYAPGQIWQIEDVEITYAKTCTGGRALTVYLVGNMFSAVTVVSALETVTSSNIVSHHEYDASGNTFPVFSDLKLILSWGTGSGATDAPIVKKIEIKYSESNVIQA